MSWAYILPGGPTVLFRWLHSHATSLWSLAAWAPLWDPHTVYHYLESVIAVYVLGRCLGKVIANKLSVSRSKVKYSIRVTRVVTATLFVHVFAAGLVPESWTVLLRLVTAILAGMLCGMTSIASLGEVIVHAVWNVSTATKTYWIGFFTCVFLTSFIRANQNIFLTPLVVLGVALVAKLVFSPLFLTGAVVAAEIVLRFLLAFTPNHAANIPQQISTRPAALQGTPRKSTPSSSSSSSLSASKRRRRSDQKSPTARLPPSVVVQPENRPDANSNSSYSSLESERAAAPTSYESEICIYRNHQCVYTDGTPAYVPQGDCINTVPGNFLEFYNYDRARARRAWEATQEWRRANNVWRIHTMPNRWFPRIKQAYPHYVHGHSKVRVVYISRWRWWSTKRLTNDSSHDFLTHIFLLRQAGFPIVYEQPGRMRLKELFRSGCEIDDMIFHYQFLMEFFSNVICQREEVQSLSSSSSSSANNSGDASTWGLMVVMDVQGFGLSSLSNSVLSYLKQAGEVNKSHYPLCTKRAFIVKTPYFLAGAWSGLKSILPDTVQVDILSESKYLKALREFIDDDQIPPEYGGSSPYRLGEHPYELSLRQLVEERLAEDAR